MAASRRLFIISLLFCACGGSPSATSTGPVGNSGTTSVGGEAVASGGSADVARRPGDTVSPGGAASVGGSATDVGGTSIGGVGGAAPTLQELTYVVDDTSVFANPERGIYRHRETSSASFSALNAKELASLRTEEAITLVMRVFYLDSFVDADISADYLGKMSADLNAARSAGVKLVLRFAYTQSEDGNDATKERILTHVAQLKPLLTDNADVIATVQAGFVGAWGEWYYTQHFGNAGKVSTQDFDNRKAVVDALLEALPMSRTVQLRTPAYKRRLYGETALSVASAFAATSAARVGHHNDAFVADETDMGTYLEPDVDMPYLQQDSAFVPVGGENDQYQAPRTACPSALTDMARFHWSFINTDYLAETITQWQQQGCYEIMRKRLGYRLALTSAKLPTTSRVGAHIAVSLSLKNGGFAAPFNPRAVELVLRDAESKKEYRLALDTDPRRWAPAEMIVVEQDVELAGVPAGSYDLLLALPDPMPSLHDKPEYAIRLANADSWDAELRANTLKARLVVTE